VNDFEPFAHLIGALRPWLGQLVIVGGWAHRLYRLHPTASPPTYAPLQTRDADLAISLSGRLAGDVGSALKDAGFNDTLSSDHTPPITRYVLGTAKDGFYAEFLAPLYGSGTTRHGKPDATVARAGVTAQKLRYLDLLLTSPWTVRLTRDAHPGFAKATDVQIANPAAFIVQKLLIYRERLPRKQAQDALYVHDTLQLFAPKLDELNVLWNTSVRTVLPNATATRVLRLANEQFGRVTDTIRAAVRLPADRTISPERFRAACSLGLEELLETRK
jgi:nucleotidyltransferase-like protein